VSTPTLADLRAAHARIAPFVHRTPVLTCAAIDARVGAEVVFKCENLQKVGAFKYRGATNAVQLLDDATAALGVATHSSGNHAQALALAARVRGIPAHIVMPRTAPAVKRAAVEGYGAEVVTCEPTLAAREETLREVVARTGAHVVHPYNDVRVIAGQGTAALELLADVPGLDVVMTPVGGGGLLSGTAIAVTETRPGVRVVAAEPQGADDAARSLAAGEIQPSVNPVTICDGLLTSLGTLTFPIIRQRVDRIVTVSDDAVIAAMRLVWERMKLVVEPSAVVGLAALLEKRDEVGGRRIGIVLSGGNVDLERLPWAPK
jgi:threonine dehydratase